MKKRRNDEIDFFLLLFMFIVPADSRTHSQTLQLSISVHVKWASFELTHTYKISSVWFILKWSALVYQIHPCNATFPNDLFAFQYEHIDSHTFDEFVCVFRFKRSAANCVCDILILDTFTQFWFSCNYYY